MEDFSWLTSQMLELCIRQKPIWVRLILLLLLLSCPRFFLFQFMAFIKKTTTCFPSGPGEAVESPPSTTSLSSHKPYTPLSASVLSTTPSAATPTSGNVGGGSGPTSTAPDLDRSIVQKARDHLTSGSTSGSINLTVDYMDASGKMIRRSGVKKIGLVKDGLKFSCTSFCSQYVTRSEKIAHSRFHFKTCSSS